MMKPPPPIDTSTGAVSMADALPIEDLCGRHEPSFFTVALGASAGGVEAIMRFFAHMPSDSGCAFVVVMHLSAERESRLAELIGKSTCMPAVQVDSAVDVEANRIYIGPPGHHLEMHNGRLTPKPIGTRPRRPIAVDEIMVSLATDQRERAIGVVLTGVDADGAVGVKAIKSEGGFTIAQSPSSAMHPGMPTSAVATGAVDRQLAIEEMPAAILDYIHHTGLASPSAAAPTGSAQILSAVLETLRAHDGLDFRGFKTPMLLRRMQRRMGLARMPDLARYAELVATNVREARALADDLLINVTEFFRESEAWKVLASDVLPGLLESKRAGDAVRIWVPACSSGEEAYSLAMLMHEQDVTRDLRLKVQVFGTDVDAHALAIARKGRYPNTIEHTVSPERLHRFFARAGKDYQVRKELRDCVMFASQNVATDPPFSRMSLVSCRNLLIYMEPELQRRVLQTLHFSLDPDGLLLLGKSETVGGLHTMFVPVSTRARIFRRIGVGRPVTLGSPAMPSWRFEPPRSAAGKDLDRIDYGHIIRGALLEHRIAAAVLTNRDGVALYFYGPVQAYLQQPDGLPTTDLFAMLGDDLRPSVRAAIHGVATDGTRVETGGVARDAEGNEFDVRATVAPVSAAGREGLLLVTFERVHEAAPAKHIVPAPEATALRILEDELQGTKRELRGAIEELESTNEELKVANEEAMSINEELQSSNEELETSKEELQSINEELTTVNAQLQEKVLELEQANNDMGNLLSSTHIPTLFLDRELNIKRFTPAATRLFSLLPGDVDRPLTDLASQSDLGSLIEDARRVLADLAPVEHETSSSTGEHFLRRTLPYRTQEDRIEGVVVTFIDVTQIKRAAAAQSRFASVMQGSDDAIIMHGLDGRILAWNRGAQTMYGYAEADVVGTDIARLLPPDIRPTYAAQIENVLRGERERGVETRRRCKNGSPIDVSATVSVIVGDDGGPTAVTLVERDITPAKEAERALRESELRFRTLADSAPVLIWMSDADGLLQFVNKEFVEFTGLVAARAAGLRWIDLIQHEDQPKVQRVFTPDALRAHRREEVNARLRHRSGGFRWVKVCATAHPATETLPAGWIGSMADVDEQIVAEHALRVSDKRKDEFLAMLGHELRNPLVPIRNAAEILNRVAGDDPHIGWVRDTLVRQVAHVTRLVDDLLDISHVTRGTLRLHLEPIEIGHVVARAIDGVEPLIKRRRHHFERHLPSEPIWVEGDAVRLAQVVDNLLTNAAKYTDEGGSVTLTLERDEKDVIVRVSDTGVGIAPEMQSRIFDLFVQDQRSIDRSQGGLGIGLAHGGSVGARSEGVGKGSELTMRLPLLPAGAVAQDEATPEARPVTGGRVLVVEDDHEAGTSLVVLLKLYGYEAELANALAPAMHIARRFKPQVVLLDLGLPGVDGFEVASRLRALPEIASSTTFFAISGFGQPDDFRRTMRAGFAHHLVKPVDPAKLDDLLRESLAASADPDEPGVNP
jgi:two-component system CheB/CheR fusion protein